MKKIFFKVPVLIAMMTIVIFSSCSNEDEVDIVDTKIVEFFPEDKNLIRSNVEDFLNNYQLKEDGKRYEVNFRDRDINETLWIIEAASNYMKNVNLDLENLEVREYQMTVETFLDRDRKIKVQGENIANAFHVLIENIQRDEERGKLANLIDVRVESISEEAAIFSAYVNFGKDLRSQDCNFSEGAPIHSSGSNDGAERIENCIMLNNVTINPVDTDPNDSAIPVVFYTNVHTFGDMNTTNSSGALFTGDIFGNVTVGTNTCNNCLLYAYNIINWMHESDLDQYYNSALELIDLHRDLVSNQHGREYKLVNVNMTSDIILTAPNTLFHSLAGVQYGYINNF